MEKNIALLRGDLQIIGRPLAKYKPHLRSIKIFHNENYASPSDVSLPTLIFSFNSKPCICTTCDQKLKKALIPRQEVSNKKLFYRCLSTTQATHIESEGPTDCFQDKNIGHDSKVQPRAPDWVCQNLNWREQFFQA